jgi:hypothetical protein
MQSLLTLITILLLVSTNSFAEDLFTTNMVDKTHRQFSKNILSFSNSVDEFFSNTENIKVDKNKSKLKISFSTRFREAAGPYVIPDLNYRLILPNTQNKLRLVLESDDEEKNNGDTSENITSNRAADSENTTTAGLMYLVEKSGIKFAATSGVLVKIPIDIFMKLSAQKSIEFDNWLFKINEQVKWINNSGLTSNLDLNFDKRLSRKTLFRFVNNVSWNDQDYVILFENGPSLFHEIDKTKAISYHAHVLTHNEPDFLVTNYIISSTYRQNAYKDWLFVSLTPYLNFPRTENFHRVPGFILGLDAIFGHI